MSFENDEQLAARAIEDRAYDQAVRLLRPLAERNSEYALLTLGWIYETGATGVPDKDVARSFYEHAVTQGSATACLYLGWLLLTCGDETEAKAAFECGFQRGNHECKSELQRLADYADEKTVANLLEQESFKEALRLLRPLAERNSEYALLCLGHIFETGLTGVPDMDTARSCYQRAAAQGRGPA
ncbi:MAG: tetratricopeptide repeat protein, partial [Sphingomicrobium sp.]